MKRLFFIFFISAIGCNGTKTTSNKPAVAADEESPLPMTDNIPTCVDSLINVFTKEEKQNPPRKIFSYIYQNKTVYYVTAPCCDFFTDLYSSDCKLMGHPDGGITGRGDGKFPDFLKERSDEKLVWEDKRQ